jgi:hypothetical protein
VRLSEFFSRFAFIWVIFAKSFVENENLRESQDENLGRLSETKAQVMARNLNGKKQLDALPPSRSDSPGSPKQRSNLSPIHGVHGFPRSTYIPPLQPSLRLLVGSVMNFGLFAIAIMYLNLTL